MEIACVNYTVGSPGDVPIQASTFLIECRTVPVTPLESREVIHIDIAVAIHVRKWMVAHRGKSRNRC